MIISARPLASVVAAFSFLASGCNRGKPTQPLTTESLTSQDFLSDPNYLRWKSYTNIQNSPDKQAKLERLNQSIASYKPGEEVEVSLKDIFTPQLAAALLDTIKFHQFRTRLALEDFFQKTPAQLLSPKCRPEAEGALQIYFQHAFELANKFTKEAPFSGIIQKNFAQDEMDCLEINSAMLIAQILLAPGYMKESESLNLSPTFCMLVDNKLFRAGETHLTIAHGKDNLLEKCVDASILGSPQNVNHLSLKDPRILPIGGWGVTLTKIQGRIHASPSSARLMMVP